MLGCRRLAVEIELRAAVLLPAAFGLLGAELFLFAVADHAKAVCGYAGIDLSGARRIGTVFAEGKIVLRRATVVAVAAVDDANAGICVEIGVCLGYGCLR